MRFFLRAGGDFSPVLVSSSSFMRGTLAGSTAGLKVLELKAVLGGEREAFLLVRLSLPKGGDDATEA